MLLDAEQLIPVCSFCERERGKAQLQPGQAPSHGLCRRHAKETYMSQLRMSDADAEAKTAHMSQNKYWHDWPR